MSARSANSRSKGYRLEPPVSRFSRQWFTRGLRTGVWVAVVTVMVWVYADLHFTATKDVKATLHIHTGSADDVVLLSRSDVPIEFRIEGRRNFVDRFLDSLSAQKSVLIFDPSRRLGAGRHPERVAEILSGMAEFRDSGLEVVSARPRDIEIHLDKLKDVRGVPVAFKYTGAMLAEPARIKPDRVSLRLPLSQSQGLDPAKLTLMTATLDLRDVPPGKPVTRSVDLLPPPGVDHARLIPQTVAVTFKVLQPIDKKEFAVSVAVQSPRSWLMNDTWNQYKLEAKPPEDWTRKIIVVGDRIDLEKLGAEKIRAYIVLTDNDLKPVGSWLPGEVKVQFPPELKVHLAEPVQPVSYRLAKRSEAPPGP